jgi:hypothetical protein
MSVKDDLETLLIRASALARLQQIKTDLTSGSRINDLSNRVWLAGVLRPFSLPLLHDKAGPRLELASAYRVGTAFLAWMAKELPPSSTYKLEQQIKSFATLRVELLSDNIVLSQVNFSAAQLVTDLLWKYLTLVLV